MKRKRLKRHRPGSWFLILGGLIVALGWFTRQTSVPSVPLSKLPIPEIRTVYLPDIMPFFPMDTGPVLGAQDFDPIEIVPLINAEREKVGAPALRMNPTLMKAAKMRADVILKYQNFSHHDPHEGIELATVLPKLGYNFVYASENIGMDGGGPETFVFGFMHSSAHRENLLRADLTETGVSMVMGNYKEYYVNIVVQLFAIPGGRDEYLGYNKEDKRVYELALADSERELNPLMWTFQKLVGNADYSDERYKKLSRRREILRDVYDQMRQDAPLDNRHVAMIMEYNESLN